MVVQKVRNMRMREVRRCFSTVRDAPQSDVLVVEYALTAGEFATAHILSRNS